MCWFCLINRLIKVTKNLLVEVDLLDHSTAEVSAVASLLIGDVFAATALLLWPSHRAGDVVRQVSDIHSEHLIELLAGVLQVGMSLCH